MILLCVLSLLLSLYFMVNLMSLMIVVFMPIIPLLHISIIIIAIPLIRRLIVIMCCFFSYPTYNVSSYYYFAPAVL